MKNKYAVILQEGYDINDNIVGHSLELAILDGDIPIDNVEYFSDADDAFYFEDIIYATGLTIDEALKQFKELTEEYGL